MTGFIALAHLSFTKPVYLLLGRLAKVIIKVVFQVNSSPGRMSGSVNLFCILTSHRLKLYIGSAENVFSFASQTLENPKARPRMMPRLLARSYSVLSLARQLNEH
jgi:hypothetical protein